MRNLVVLTGAGISAESGLQTFRDNGGLWENHRVEEVATPDAWAANPELVLKFYNERRRALKAAEPNAGHRIIAELENTFRVQIITQNVDNLHERAGSTKVLHLHGELTKARSTKDEDLVYDIGYRDLCLGDRCQKGGQLRPHIVWFGEPVPLMDEAARLTAQADVFIIAGTSLAVYPAAGLVDLVPLNAEIYCVDPRRPAVYFNRPVTFLERPACAGMAELKRLLAPR